MPEPVTKHVEDLDTMLDEYHFDYSKAEWGKFAGKVRRTKLAIDVEPKVAVAFSDSESVNSALRSLIEISKKAVRKRKRRATSTGATKGE